MPVRFWLIKENFLADAQGVWSLNGTLDSLAGKLRAIFLQAGRKMTDSVLQLCCAQLLPSKYIFEFVILLGPRLDKASCFVS